MNDYVVLKLISGEQLIASLLNETSEGIVVLDPIVVRMHAIVRDGTNVEQAVTSRFCQFGEDNVFAFHYRNLIYRKKLDPDMIPYYTRIVKALEAEDNMIDPPEELLSSDIPIDRIIH